MMMLKGQNGIAKGCAAQLWRERQQGVRAFFALHLQPSSQPANLNNSFIGLNTVVGENTRRVVTSDYRSIH